jgi:hypothetical protein
MVALLLYAYGLGERSSRRLERGGEREAAVLVLAATQRPDPPTLARVRQTHEAAWARRLTQILRLCAEAGLVKVGVVALDGTQRTANAALAATRTAEAMAQDVAPMRREAAAIEATEDRLSGAERRGDERPEPVRNRAGRRARLKACQERLTREAAEAPAAQQATRDARPAAEAATGQKRRGRQPQAPEPVADAAATATGTDPDRRSMKTPPGSGQGDHAHAGVTEAQLMVAAAVTQDATDVQPLPPMGPRRKSTCGALGSQRPVAPSGRMPVLAARTPWRRIRPGRHCCLRQRRPGSTGRLSGRSLPPADGSRSG